MHSRVVFCACGAPAHPSQSPPTSSAGQLCLRVKRMIASASLCVMHGRIMSCACGPHATPSVHAVRPSSTWVAARYLTPQAILCFYLCMVHIDAGQSTMQSRAVFCTRSAATCQHALHHVHNAAQQAHALQCCC